MHVYYPLFQGCELTQCDYLKCAYNQISLNTLLLCIRNHLSSCASLSYAPLNFFSKQESNYMFAVIC